MSLSDDFRGARSVLSCGADEVDAAVAAAETDCSMSSFDDTSARGIDLDLSFTQKIISREGKSLFRGSRPLNGSGYGIHNI